MNYLSREDVLDLHGYIIERFGGRLGLTSHDRLLSLVQSANQTMFGEELYPDLASKIATIAFALVKNRPFRSGNTATALLACLRFAEMNDYTITDVSQLTHELRALAKSQRSKEDVAMWIQQHLTENIEHHPEGTR